MSETFSGNDNNAKYVNWVAIHDIFFCELIRKTGDTNFWMNRVLKTHACAFHMFCVPLLLCTWDCRKRPMVVYIYGELHLTYEDESSKSEHRSARILQVFTSTCTDLHTVLLLPLPLCINCYNCCTQRAHCCVKTSDWNVGTNTDFVNKTRSASFTLFLVTICIFSE
jgi:hypothetical protein